MLYLSIALVIIACITGWLVNKWLDQRQLELNIKNTINNEATEEALSAATAKLHKQFDERINKTWETIQITKADLESLRLQIAIKGR